MTTSKKDASIASKLLKAKGTPKSVKYVPASDWHRPSIKRRQVDSKWIIVYG